MATGADLQQVSLIAVTEGRPACEELVREHAHAPRVYFVRVRKLGLLLVVGGQALEGANQDLRCHVVKRASTRHRRLVVRAHGQAEVGELDDVTLSQEQILGLYVAMDDVVCVQVGERAQARLQHKLHQPLLRQAHAILVKVGVEVAVYGIILHQDAKVRLRTILTI